MEKVLQIWTDGSCKQSTGEGGLGVVFVYEGKVVHELFDYYNNVTNNQMEIMAIASALYMIHQPVDRIEIFTDSQYCLGILNDGWSMNTNHQWWEQVKQAKKQAHQYCKNIKFYYTRGHGDDPHNNRADLLATIASGYRKEPPGFKLVRYSSTLRPEFGGIPNDLFDVTISQSLSKTIRMKIEGLPSDISDVNWHEIYFKEHKSPIDLIQILKRKCEEAIVVLEQVKDADVSSHIAELKYISQECEGWAEDDREVISDTMK